MLSALAFCVFRNLVFLLQMMMPDPFAFVDLILKLIILPFFNSMQNFYTIKNKHLSSYQKPGNVC